jgi:hypothetical protein
VQSSENALWLSPDVADRSFERRVAVLAFLWPFVYHLPYLVTLPGIGRQTANDFSIIYFRYKVYLLDVMASEGRLPLWSPSEAAGFSFFGNPFPASVYPLNLPLTAWYRWAEGYSHQDHQVFALLGAAIFSLGLFKWLRATRLPVLPALLGALVFASCMRITDLMRLTNALHAAAWLPWILLGMTRAVERRTVGRGALIVAVSTVFLLTAGYPYTIYYLQFLLGPYLLMLLVRAGRDALFCRPVETFVGVRPFLLWMGAAFGGALAVCFPYLSRVAELIEQVHARSGGDYAFSIAGSWDLPNTLGTLIYPPAASGEGWYYFGIVHLFILLLFSLGVVSRHESRHDDRRLMLLFIPWFAVISCITLGEGSPLFTLLWKVWPGFSALRQWSRLHIVVLPVFALLLARAYFAFFEHLVDPMRGTRPEGRRIFTALAVLYAAVLLAQFIFIETETVSYQWPLYFERYFDQIPWIDQRWYLLSSTLAFLFVAAVLHRAHGVPRYFEKRLALVAVALMALGTLDVAPLGLLQWSEAKQERDMVRVRPQVVDRMMLALSRPRTARYVTVPLRPEFNVGSVEDWSYARYIDFLAGEGIDKAALKQPARWMENESLAQLLGILDGRRIYFSRTFDHTTSASFLADSIATEGDTDLTVNVVEYDGDHWVVEIDTERSGYLCFIDNWDPNWIATVNQQPSKIEVLLGTFKAVAVDAGKSRIVLRYELF